MFRIFFFSILLLFSVGCSYKLTIHTQPAGALVKYTQNGQTIAIAPFTQEYQNNNMYKKNGCFHVLGMTATWVSGATTSTPQTIALCGPPRNYVYTISRPADAPDLEKDMNFALQVQQAINSSIAANAANDMAIIQAFQATMPKTTTGTITPDGTGGIKYQETTR